MFAFIKSLFTEPESERPSPFFDQPWRKIDWNRRREMVDELERLLLRDTGLAHPRILLHGPISAGKSSFINSVKSVFADRVVVSVLAENSGAGTSFTTKYQSHYIEGKNMERLHVVFNDIMGMEPQLQRGVHTEDIKLALTGHVMHDYAFNPSSPLKEGNKGYNARPSHSDKVHCLVSVLSADAISRMDKGVIDKLRAVREAASRLDIPQFVIMTMPDKACGDTAKDLEMIYRSKVIIRKMEECSMSIGVPMTCILPVKNYSQETEVDNDMDILVLKALTQILHAANDYNWSRQQHQ